jgi:SAM-dependent methyltransferase
MDPAIPLLRPAAAALADRHRLYELAVQSPETEIDFVDRTYRRLRGRGARWLREDFCGTGAVARAWVRRCRLHHALAVDLDPEVLEWGRRRTQDGLTAGQRRRLELVEQDVLAVRSGPMDVVLALNFSYWLLRGRQALKDYFRKVRAALAPGGVFFLDAYGGYDSYRVMTEERLVEDPALGAFTYIWDQAAYDPVTGRLLCHIHFAFPDGSRLERAFSYDWRLWSLPEIRELLAEAGFSRVTVYWQGWDADGKPDGHFVPVERGEPDAGWIAYLTAEP